MADGRAQDKKLVRRLDFMIIPWLTFLYLVSFLGELPAREIGYSSFADITSTSTDRTNIGNAKVSDYKTNPLPIHLLTVV